MEFKKIGIHKANLLSSIDIPFEFGMSLIKAHKHGAHKPFYTCIYA